MKVSKAERDKAIMDLRKMLAPGDTVFTVLRNQSRSGMSRRIDCYKLEDNQPRWLSRLVAKATGFTFSDKHEAIRVDGCGMDMGFHVVSTLSRVLCPDGFTCIGNNQRCPSNDHSNGDQDYTPHHHNAGDYALRHRWM